MTVAEIARKIGGRLEGEGSVEITGLANLSEACPGQITFLSGHKYKSMASSTAASAIVTGEDLDIDAPCAVIRVENPDKGFALVASMFEDRGDQGGGVHPSAVVAADVKLGEGVSIGPCCVLESGCSVGRRTRIDAGCFIGSGTTLGEDCRLYPRVVIRERTRVGQRVIIHPGAVIGSDGFGYYREGASWQKIPQLGTVQIGDDTEIGANVTIDRARVGTTAIGSGVKIDNLVQVAHNVKIGDNTAMAAQAGISGSSRIGGNVMIGGQAGVSGHLSVGDQSVVFARGGVTKDVPAGSKVSGFPAMDHRKQMRLNAEWVNLQKRRQRIRELENRIEQLESRLAD